MRKGGDMKVLWEECLREGHWRNVCEVGSGVEKLMGDRSLETQEIT